MPRRFDEVFSLFSDIGKVEILTILLVIFLIVLKKIMAGLITISLYIIFHLIEIYGKFFVDHPPPPEFMLRTKRILEFPQFHVRAEFSYPSGHSGRTVFLSTLVLVLLWQSKRVSKTMKLVFSGAIGLFAITMLISRVYLGEHWSTDVIGGSILGASFGLISSAIYLHTKKIKKEKQKEPGQAF